MCLTKFQDNLEAIFCDVYLTQLIKIILVLHSILRGEL